MKDAYYFSHDCNARHDPKCSALIHEYGMEGYGVFWALIEILSEQEDYKLKKFGKLYEGLARQLNVEIESFRSIASAMLNDYELLLEDGSFIWSESLLSRMQLKEEKRERRANAGRKGGLKSGESRSKGSNASAMLKQNEAKRSKESKVNESNNKDIVEIVTYLNELLGSKFSADTKETVKLISGRLTQGYTLDDFKYVIDLKFKQWRNDSKMSTFLKPKTLFNESNFESYVNEKEVVTPISNKQDFKKGMRAPAYEGAYY